MNAMMLQLLAQKAGLPEGASREEILGSLAADQPQLQAVLGMLEQQRQRVEAELRELEAEAESADLLEEDSAPEESGAERGNGDVSEVIAEVLTLRKRCDAVALAVGACLICWGEDRRCPHCAGQGRAGWRAPDRAYFREIVMPAVSRMRDSVGRSPERMRRR